MPRVLVLVPDLSVLDLKNVTGARVGDEEAAVAGGTYHLIQDWRSGPHCRQKERKSGRQWSEEAVIFFLVGLVTRYVDSFMNTLCVWNKLGLIFNHCGPINGVFHPVSYTVYLIEQMYGVKQISALQWSTYGWQDSSTNTIILPMWLRVKSISPAALCPSLLKALTLTTNRVSDPG